jgi:hypothetical protein
MKTRENKEVFFSAAARALTWALIFTATAVFWIAVGLALAAWWW